MADSRPKSWPFASFVGQASDEWPIGIAGYTVTRTVSYRLEHVATPSTVGDCAGQDPVTEYYETSFTETATASRSAPYYHAFKMYMPLSFGAYDSYLVGCASYPTGNFYSPYAPVGMFICSGSPYGAEGTKTGSWASGTASCVWDTELTPPAWKFKVVEDSGTIDTHASDLPFVYNIFRRWLHSQWGFVASFDRLKSADKNWGGSCLVNGLSKTFTLDEPAPPLYWHFVYYSETLSITLNPT